MSVIARAATDPAFDIEKMERLMQMHQQLTAQKALAAFNSAMSEAQAEMTHFEVPIDIPKVELEAWAEKVTGASLEDHNGGRKLFRFIKLRSFSVVISLVSISQQSPDHC